MEEGEPPLVVDLDGTLLRSDLLVETGLDYLREQPLRADRPLRWLLQGKAALKDGLARQAGLDAATLPYDAHVLAFLRAQRTAGRRLVLATASHRTLAERVAAHLGLFDAVLATEHGHNLSAGRKRDALVTLFGDGGYDYVGNSADDLPVWAAARQAWVANAPAGVLRRARAVGNVAGTLGEGGASWRDWLRAVRLHQWLKNLLLFVPLLAAHRSGEPALLRDALLAFVCFGLCASSVYLLNDLLDLRDDRHHPRKRQRPFAAGRVPVLHGLLAWPALLGAAFALAAWQLPGAFVAALAGYYALTLAYSLRLKRRLAIDVIALATLYTLRVVAGAFALGIALSFWLLAFSMFVFLSLALVKRYSELHALRAAGGQAARGRGYVADDLPIVAALGAASGYLAVMVLALYINDARTLQLYRRPELIWLACPLLLLWVSRVWMLAHRGQVNEDPLLFALRDRASLLTGGMLGAIFWAAT